MQPHFEVMNWIQGEEEKEKKIFHKADQKKTKTKQTQPINQKTNKQTKKNKKIKKIIIKKETKKL